MTRPAAVRAGSVTSVRVRLVLVLTGLCAMTMVGAVPGGPAVAGGPPPAAPAPEGTPFDQEAAAAAGRQTAEPSTKATEVGAAQTQGAFATHTVFATRYNPTIPGSVEVAVPDKCVKWAARRETANLSRFGCSAGYRLDLDYRVLLRRANGQSAVFPVNEVGPWNIDDNYWNPPTGVSRPRRLFGDLPQGLPEAQAAFQQNYNAKPCNNLNGTPAGRVDGADQFSRCVLNPAGIDLSQAAANQLGMVGNEWLTVSFLWEPPNWEYLGGYLTSGPDVASWSSGRLDIFVRGGDNALWHKWWAGGWSGWENLGGLLTSDPSAVAWGANRLDVFARGGDNALWRRAWNGAGWTPWERVGGLLTSGPDAASWAPGRLDVFVRGGDNALWHGWTEGSSPFTWENLGGLLTSDPSGVAQATSRLDVFARGGDNALWHRAWNGTAWGPWESLGGLLTSGPDAASWGPGRLDVFVRGTDNALWHGWSQSSPFYAWEKLGGVLTSDPTAVSWGFQRLDVFARGGDNALYHRWWEPPFWAP